MHEGEFHIDDGVVRGLVDVQFPQWSDLPLVRVDSSGTVHAIYRLGDAMAVRLPRHPDFMAALEREAKILPALAPYLPLKIPELIATGEAAGRFPSLWSIVGWIDGEPLERVSFSDPVAAATQLGEFVVAMRSIAMPGEPSTNQRGRPLAATDEWTRRSIAAVAGEFDPAELTRIWEAALGVPRWDGQMTWIHGDLMPGNLLVVDGELGAVLDFGDVRWVIRPST